MASLSIVSLVSSFDGEDKLIARGENHVKSGHVEAFSYSAGVLRGEIYASMKQDIQSHGEYRLLILHSFTFVAARFWFTKCLSCPQILHTLNSITID